MFDNSCYFLTYIYFKRDSYICDIMSGLLRVEDRRSHAVAHLASARSQKAGTGIPDIFFWRKIREKEDTHVCFIAGCNGNPYDCRS